MTLGSPEIIALIGIVMTLITTIGVFILNKVSKNQENTNAEIKELNKDIRDVLIQLGRSDEKFLSLNQRVDEIIVFNEHLDDRITKLESK